MKGASSIDNNSLCTCIGQNLSVWYVPLIFPLRNLRYRKPVEAGARQLFNIRRAWTPVLFWADDKWVLSAASTLHRRAFALQTPMSINYSNESTNCLPSTNESYSNTNLSIACHFLICFISDTLDLSSPATLRDHCNLNLQFQLAHWDEQQISEISTPILICSNPFVLKNLASISFILFHTLSSNEKKRLPSLQFSNFSFSLKLILLTIGAILVLNCSKRFCNRWKFTASCLNGRISF